MPGPPAGYTVQPQPQQPGQPQAQNPNSLPPGYTVAGQPDNLPPGYQLKTPPASPTAQPGPTNEKTPPGLPDPKTLPRLGWNMPDTDYQLDQMAGQLGMSKTALRTIAQLETGGMGLKSYEAKSSAGAEGIMQMLPGTFKSVNPTGNILNMRDNVQAGSMYYKHLLDKYDGNYVIAAGAYNMGPGAMDHYLATGTGLPHETAVYMAHMALAMSAPSDTPVPPDPTSKKTLNPPRKVTPSPMQTAAHANTDPMKAHHSAIDELAGQADLPFIMMNAHNMDEVQGGHKNMDAALRDYRSDPAGAAQYYGLNSKEMLKFYAQHDPDPMDRRFAQSLLNNPTAAAWLTFGEEMFNPMSWAEGKGLGGVLHGLNGWAQKSELGRSVTHLASPYRELITRFGSNVRNIVAQIGARAQQGAKDASNLVTEVFGTGQYDEAAQREIGRLYQGLVPDPRYAAQYPDMERRAKILLHQMHQLDLDQENALVLKAPADGRKHLYLPMSNAYTHPYYDPEAVDTIEDLRRGGGPGYKPPRKGKIYANLDESIKSGKLRDDWSIAQAIEQHVRARRGNISFAEGLQKLAAKHPDAIRFGAQFSRKPPIGLHGKQMIKASSVMPNIRSPQLKDAWIDPSLANETQSGWLQKRPAMLAGRTLQSDEAITNVGQAVWRNFNGTMRGLMMYNPIFHPFWNIATNASAASGAQVGEMMTNYLSVIANQAGEMADVAKQIPGVGKVVGGIKGAIFDRVWKGSQAYADATARAAAAAAAGAHAAFGGTTTFLRGNGARIRTLPFSSLSTAEKFDKTITRLSDWNKKLTFDKAGEEIFSSKLYALFTDPKGKFRLNSEDAAWKVREALGNYQNVDPNSLMSKMIFFYPWLKTDLPFWLEKFVTHPQYTASITSATDRQRQLAGDPKEFDPNYAESPFTVYEGQDAEGNDVRQTLPFPMKNAADLVNALDPRGSAQGGPDATQRAQSGLSLVTGRYNPLASTAYNTVGTVLDRKAGDPGEYHGYEVMFDKDTHDVGTEIQQWGKSAAGILIPVPFPYLTHQMVKDGIHLDRTGEYIQEMMGAGTITHSQGQSVLRQHAVARAVLERHINKIEKAQHGPNPLTQKQLSEHIQAAVKQYQTKIQNANNRLSPSMRLLMDQANKRLDAQETQEAPPKQGLPPGYTETQPPPGYTVSP